VHQNDPGGRCCTCGERARSRQTVAMSTRPTQPASIAGSAFAGCCFPPDVIVLAARWYLRVALTDRDVEELLAERGVEVDHRTICRWVQRFTPLLAEAARPCRHAVGQRRFVDETSVKAAGRWRYVDRAVDQFGQVIDVFVAVRRDTVAARRCFEQAIGTTRITPSDVVTDRAPTYPVVPEDLLPAAWHPDRSVRQQPHRGRPHHGRLKARLDPMRGLKQDRGARVVIAGQAFVQNVGRGTTSRRSRRRCTCGWRSRLTSSPWRPDASPWLRLQHAAGRPDTTAPPQAQQRGQGRLRRGPHAGRLTALRRHACRY
jgi:transposase-like protein